MKIFTTLIALTVVVFTGQAFAQDGTWTLTGSMAAARRDHTATLLTDGKVLINRGTGGSTELYDPATGAFSPTGPSLGGGFTQGSTATRLLDGRVVVVGGSPAEIYNPATGTFSPASNLNVARVDHTATLLRNGKVLIAGGQAIPAGQQNVAVAELYDPGTGTFTLTGNLNAGRHGHSATLLPDGRVLIAAGDQISSPGFATTLSSAELYDPATGTFSLIGNMIQPRCCLFWTKAPLLSSGKVLFVGGSPTQAAELFDPATGIFSSTGSMTTARGVPSVTLRPSGQVLVAGGNTTLPGGAPDTTNSAELYDPASGTFSPAASMNQARQQHAATLLLNGQVLVTGGFDFGLVSDLSSAELFSEKTLVTIDIKPGSFPNSINLNSAGVVSVAILSTSSFDAMRVNPASVTLAGARVKLIGKGDKYSCSAQDVNGDGLLDLVCHVVTEQFLIQPGDSVAIVDAETFSGQSIRGEDSIRIVPD